MALNVAVALEVRPGAGSDTNGGGFRAGASGTDWSQQNAAQYSVTDGVTNGTTTITSATANFGTDVVGNLIYVQGGTGSVAAGWYEITARTDSATITVDRSTGLTAGTGVTLIIGGALATYGQAGAIKVQGNKIWCKAGTDTLSSTSSNVSGGTVLDSTGGVSTSVSRWEGYSATRGDRAGACLLQVPASGVTTVTVLRSSGAGVEFVNLRVDGASKTSIRGIELSNNGAAILCRVSACTNRGFSQTAGIASFDRCTATTCSTAGAGFVLAGGGANVSFCESYANSVPGFLVDAGSVLFHFEGCVASGNTGGSTNGFALGSASRSYTANACVAYGNGQHGFDCNVTGTQPLRISNSISYGNGGAGYASSAVCDTVQLLNCAGGSNTSGNYNTTNLPNVYGFAALTNDPFTNAASGDFSLNSVAAGGLACQEAGYPGLLPRGTTTTYRSIGLGPIHNATPTAADVATGIWAYTPRTLTP